MKSQLNSVKLDEIEVKFPCLMLYISDNINLIVLFSEKRKGTVVYTTSDAWQLGEYKCDWVSSNFKPLLLDKSVTLRNN